VDELAKEAEETEKILDEMRSLKQMVGETLSMYRDIASFIKETGAMTPEQMAMVSSITKPIMDRIQQISRKTEPTQQAIPEEVKREISRIGGVEERIRGVEERVGGVEGKVSEVDAKISELSRKLSGYGEALVKVAESLEKHASTTSAIVSLTSEIQRVRDEIEKVKKELEEERKNKMQDSIPSIEEVDEHGRIVRKYEPHPRVKVLEKQTDFTYKTLGPTLIDELRQARSEISSNINRLISIFESAIAPEIRRRAPHLVEDMQERFRRLVGGMSEEERRKALEEIEAKLKEAEMKSSEAEKK
jgi:DNA repair exonuclease SbcCD ATPase subunit